MNAAEARKLSNDNVPKLVEKQSNEIIKSINQSIMKSAKNGEFAASVSMEFPDRDVDVILKKVESYFQDLGYTAKVYKFDEYFSIVVSWQK